MKQSQESGDSLKKQKNSCRTTILLVVLFLSGICLLIYPSFSDWWNSFHQSGKMTEYAGETENLTEDDRSVILQKADEYNRSLLTDTGRFYPDEEDHRIYEETLKPGQNGMIGILEIPKLNTELPFFHGTDSLTLQKYIGHLEGSSLPAGSASSHVILTGHRGLPSARLFTDLDQLETGDFFLLKVLDQTLVYQVDQIRIIEPEDLSCLEIEENRDYVSLITCTPYGVNSHRLVIRGIRTDKIPVSSKDLANEAQIIDYRIVFLWLCIPILILIFLFILFPPAEYIFRKKGTEKSESNGSKFP